MRRSKPLGLQKFLFFLKICELYFQFFLNLLDRPLALRCFGDEMLCRRKDNVRHLRRFPRPEADDRINFVDREDHATCNLEVINDLAVGWHDLPVLAAQAVRAALQIAFVRVNCSSTSLRENSLRSILSPTLKWKIFFAYTSGAPRP